MRMSGTLRVLDAVEGRPSSCPRHHGEAEPLGIEVTLLGDCARVEGEEASEAPGATPSVAP